MHNAVKCSFGTIRRESGAGAMVYIPGMKKQEFGISVLVAAHTELEKRAFLY